MNEITQSLDDIFKSINHTSVEALGFAHSLQNGTDTFTRGKILVTFTGAVSAVSVDDSPFNVDGIEKLKELIF